ncbi:hypothetical protein [Vibrio vulnificus YJ016]|uniref:Uncharacterized protein n=1 Tax=Vibrio vulnificus (strain YJ016) TaxID=196600 RepID=Q7MCW6_VIBVY|nr:hypothetical protein [Vibrio vulnificus YJ016]
MFKTNARPKQLRTKLFKTMHRKLLSALMKKTTNRNSKLNACCHSDLKYISL